MRRILYDGKQDLDGSEICPYCDSVGEIVWSDIIVGLDGSDNEQVTVCAACGEIWDEE